MTEEEKLERYDGAKTGIIIVKTEKYHRFSFSIEKFVALGIGRFPGGMCVLYLDGHDSADDGFIMVDQKNGRRIIDQVEEYLKRKNA